MYDLKAFEDFRTLCKHGIPLGVFFSKRTINVKALTSPVFNGKVCSLAFIPSSQKFDHFRHDANESGWVKSVLLATACGAE